jgi:predicted MPP superfamily phosphohydrolase
LGAFQLVFAGHMHDGQITVPYVTGKLRLAHIGARYTTGLYESRGTVMHVSPGLGTTLVPFRFFARPEATELVLRGA